MSVNDKNDAEEKETVDDEEDLTGSESDDNGFADDLEDLKLACLPNRNEIQIPAAADQYDAEKEESAEDGGELEEDEEVLKQVCLRTGTDPSEIQLASASDAVPSRAVLEDSDSEDDLEIFRSIRNRFALSDAYEPLSMQPISSIYPSDDDGQDEFETLRQIKRRFLAFSSNGTQESSPEHLVEKAESNELSTVVDKSSRFPRSAQLLLDALRKNRAYQKFLRNKLTQIEVKIEENKKLKERVEILKRFQVSCKKMTGRSLSLKTDPRIQLISARKCRTSKDPGKKASLDHGPPENSSVINYRMAIAQFPLVLTRKKWSKEERENLDKGIRQQFQEKMFQVSVDCLSSDGSFGGGKNLDDIIASIKDFEITPEMIREFLPKLNWDQLASMYVEGRSGAECETRWLNHEDPLINCNPWTAEEDKSLLFIIQEKGIRNWFDIALSLGTNRTPFQCLARYQRSLNVCILKREWTEEEDDQLRIAVEVFGESNWQSVASTLQGRTGTQCSNRWKTSINPIRQRVGRWTNEEDKRLKVAVMLFGPKNWKKIAEVIPGRTQVQCRERWVNSLDPALKLGSWTKEEDLMLEAAIEQHGYCWSKVAACMPSRTDNHCWRRWKVLHPEAVPLLQEARRIRKATLVSNFVDRESERPALSPNDFNISLPLMISAPENTKTPSKGKQKKGRKRPESEKGNEAAPGPSTKKRRRKSCEKRVQSCCVGVPEIINENEIETASGCDAVVSESDNCTEGLRDIAFPKKRNRKPSLESDKYTEAEEDVTLPIKKPKPPSRHANGRDLLQDDAFRTAKGKQQLESNGCIGPVLDKSSSHLPSTLCMMTNHEAESFSNSLTKERKKRPSEKRSNINTKSINEQNSVHSESSLLSGATGGAEMIQSNGVEIEVLGGDDDTFIKQSASRSGSKSKTCTSLSTSQTSSISASENCQSLSSNKNIRFQGKKSTKPKDVDCITLASFLQNKFKKSTSSLPYGMDHHGKLHEIQRGLQCCDAKSNCDVVAESSTSHCNLKQAVRPSDSDTGGVDLVNEIVSSREVMREPDRIDQVDNCDDDDKPLARFLDRSKKRQQVRAAFGR